MNKYTDPPWRIQDAADARDERSGLHDFPWEVMGAWNNDTSMLVAAAQDEADARLIASAPDLLDALQEFAAQHKCGCGHPHCNDCARDAIASAALAKALPMPPNGCSTPE